MAVSKIIVTDMIMTGNLFEEEGFDLEQSGDNLAEMKGRVILDYLEEHYPDIESYADIAIQAGKGKPRPLEVLVYSETKELDREASAALWKELSQRVDEVISSRAWAVRKT
ncbi:MAG: hypothetical protein ACOX5Z_00840 [Desulfobulbus sp.]